MGEGLDGLFALAEHFGRRLWHRRRLACLSQEDLGRLLNVHRTEVGLLERGRRVPRLDTILKLSAGVEVSPCELIAGLRWQPGSHDLVGGAYAEGSSVAGASRERVAS
jgi:transcriptional regulator with XRE-family HTH domain